MTITIDFHAKNYDPTSVHADHLHQLLEKWHCGDPSWPERLKLPDVLPFLCKELKAIKGKTESRRISDRLESIWKNLNQHDWIGARYAVAELAVLLSYGDSLSDDEVLLAANGLPGFSISERGSNATH